MTDDRKPKDMIGLRNHQGRSSLGLSDSDHPLVWVRRKRVDVEARNKGGHLTVRPSDLMAFDGYYSLGTVGGLTHVVGSPTARGNFTDRGIFGINVGGSANNANTLFYMGNGWGAANVFNPQQLTSDFNGLSPAFWQVDSWQTRFGKKFNLRLSVYMVDPATTEYGSTYTAFINYTRPVVLKTGDTHAWIFEGFAYVTTDSDGNYRPTFVNDYGSYGEIITLDSDDFQLLYGFGVDITGPRTRLGYITYFRPEYEQHPELETPPRPALPHPIDVTACKGFLFTFSDDFGRTWSPAATSLIIKEYTDTVLTLPEKNSNDDLYGYLFNQATYSIIANSSPISLRHSVILMSVPEVHLSADDPPVATITAKAKIGLVDNASHTISETGILYESSETASRGQRARNYLLGGMASIEGGVCFMVKPQNTPTPEAEYGFIYFTPNGTDIDKSAPPMPFPARQTGYLFALDPKTLGCVMWDGKYSLYESRDRGKTWTRRATVAEGPLHGSLYIQEFATVVQLRSGNAAAHSFPGAPWIGDERKDPPIT